MKLVLILILLVTTLVFVAGGLVWYLNYTTEITR